MTRHVHVLVMLVMLAACTKSTPSARKVDEDRPASTSSAASSANATWSAKSPSDDVVLLPVDTACKVDGDCVASELYEENGFCCQNCGSTAASKSWYEAARARCSGKKLWGPDCPMKKCAPPYPVVCVGGSCVTVVK